MAFSKTPLADTYSTKRIPVVSDLDQDPWGIGFSSASGYFTGMTNVLPFKNNNHTDELEFYAETRNAIKASTVVGAGGKIVRGMHVWQKAAGTVYGFVVVTNGSNTQVYTASGTMTSWTSVNTLPTNGTTPVRFTEFIDGTNTKKLVMVDGNDGYVFTSNAAGTRIVDVDFPTPHVPFPIFMDGYLFLAKADTGDIYNSDLNDPAAWTAGSFISSELYPDDVQALWKIDNYLVAIGAQGCEYFYDAANATASPLARQEGSSLPFGTLFPNTIAGTKDTVMFLANNNDGEAVFKIIESSKHTDIPAKVVTRALAVQLTAGTTTGVKLRGCLIRQNGDLFYVLNFNGTDTASGGTDADTVVFSFGTKMWSQLVSDDAGNDNYPVYFTAPSTTLNTLTYVAGHNGGNAFFGYLDPTATRDTFDGGASGTTIFQQIDIPEQDFGTLNVKIMSRCGIVMRRLDAGVTYPKLSWSDNGGSYNTPIRLAGGVFTATPTDIGFPFITQLGMFRTRRFRITSDQGPDLNGFLPTRWYAIECDINKGQQ